MRLMLHGFIFSSSKKSSLRCTCRLFLGTTSLLRSPNKRVHSCNSHATLRPFGPVQPHMTSVSTGPASRCSHPYLPGNSKYQLTQKPSPPPQKTTISLLIHHATCHQFLLGGFAPALSLSLCLFYVLLSRNDEFWHLAHVRLGRLRASQLVREAPPQLDGLDALGAVAGVPDVHLLGDAGALVGGEIAAGLGG